MKPFITGTFAGLTPVSEVDGRKLVKGTMFRHQATFFEKSLRHF